MQCEYCERVNVPLMRCCGIWVCPECVAAHTQAHGDGADAPMQRGESGKEER